jgi:phospholipid/cholesterol/gamma-HCH transport system ATP-binding protein
MENLVEIRDVKFAYGRWPVLKGVNMTVRRGSVITIMGPSGCGKTTLLRLIGGALKAKSGEVRVDGQLMNDLGR